MPALSFQEEWINKLLRGDKQQTTRPPTDRIKVGDICNIYNQQRRRIADKTLRRLTPSGVKMVNTRRKADEYCGNTYPHPPRYYVDGIEMIGYDYTHFLGKVEITEVYDLYPYDTPLDELGKWAHADGFDTFENADVWFMKQYGEEWDLKHWTVIGWHGWQERYFEPAIYYDVEQV